MDTEVAESKTAVDGELWITRVLDAPREAVWSAWTDPELVKRWWGGGNWTVPTASIDLRVGGNYHICMRSPEGQEVWSTGVFREVVAPERLVMTDSFADEQGKVVPGSHYGMSADWPLELEFVVTLEAEGDRTKLTLHYLKFPGGDDAAMAYEGWNESFDKLAKVVEAIRIP